MEKFDIERVKVGDICVTREGTDVKILCTDAKGSFPVVALMHLPGDEEEEFPISFNKEGKYGRHNKDHHWDLFMRKPDLYRILYYENGEQIQSPGLLFKDPAIAEDAAKSSGHEYKIVPWRPKNNNCK